MARRNPKFLVIDGCPAPYDVAPYIYLVLRRAGMRASSIYRGSDPQAARILHRHGKHNQAEIHRMYPSISNPPGFSQHELRNGSGGAIPSWAVGVDSGGNSESDKARVRRAAAHYGLEIRHPYARGVEGHHWQFAKKPSFDNKRLWKARVVLTRAMLRRIK
jgi:hypothetical protein